MMNFEFRMLSCPAPKESLPPPRHWRGGIGGVFGTFGLEDVLCQKTYELIQNSKFIIQNSLRTLRLIVVLMILTVSLNAQQYRVFGKVMSSTEGEAIVGATVFIQNLNLRTTTNREGIYEIFVPLRRSPFGEGTHKLEVFKQGKQTTYKIIRLNAEQEVNFKMDEITRELDGVEVTDEHISISGISRLRAVEGLSIYEAKKNELIILDDFAANKVSNNARQVFARVPGLNIWESDFAGLQLDIAARGLGPSRTANFNTRQNGYDMSADALGYPESYYLPAMQAVERIEVVRGAASLQYGTQFGGMLNFKLKEAPEKPVEVNLEQAVGSFGYLNSFLSVGGKPGKWDYYGYYQYRKGDGWRKNSGFDAKQAFVRLGNKVTEKFKAGFEYSYLDYQAQQPGGLTDEDFQSGNLKRSRRNRNWFQVNWNLFATNLDYDFSTKTQFNLRAFVLNSRRDALGNLQQIDRIDNPNQNRTLISDRFQNFGAEARLLHYFNLLGSESVLISGTRFYDGLTDRTQGNASNSSTAHFLLNNPSDPEDFDYNFPSNNYSFFTESVLNLTDKLSVTPGIRFEYIRTDAVGKWKQIVKDFAGNIKAINTFEEDRSVRRSFVLLGLGAGYYLNPSLNLYANFSENFRSVTFSDLRLNNPNFVLDSKITDESGFNADLGIRGNLTDWLSTDTGLFYLKYNDRIGVLLPAGSTILLRTNVGDSRHIGLESYLEANFTKLFSGTQKETSLSVFSNLSWINAIYTRSRDTAIQGNRVEYVPNLMFRSGLNYRRKNLKASYQFSFLGSQFSDATNSIRNPNALTGEIPAYFAMDLSLEYEKGRYKITSGVNNLTNEKYFTRRAESYPGPGIIPATIRSFYLSLGIRF